MHPPPGGAAQAPAPTKRVSNLTSGAFGFALATPSKTSAKGKERAEGERKDGQPMISMSGFGMGAFQTPRKEVVVKQEISSAFRIGGGGGEGSRSAAGRDVGTPIRETSFRPIATLSSIPAALSKGLVSVKKEEGDDRSLKTPRKLTTLSSMSTPWSIQSRGLDRPVTPDSSSSTRKRKLGDLEVHLPGAQPKKEEKEDLGRRVALRYMGEGVRLEGVVPEEIAKDDGEKEVGIGISPRKGKVKWTGRGERPLALRLNALLTTQSSSLTLFYTSLQHTLYPSHPSNRSSSKPKVETSTLITPLEHIRTAPMRLRLIRPLATREHVAQLWLASVRTWPTQPLRGYQHGVDGDEAPEEVIVNFAQAAKGAAAAGGANSDVKILAGRWWDKASQEEEGGKWEVGVWSEWSFMDLPMEDAGENEEEDTGRKRKVVFVSRYLIAERH